ncbi:MAG: ABC transporter ATP-binding protein [Treponema sp.]|nr:ABC transporter ATP-binding protein [Treponema sp.]
MGKILLGGQRRAPSTLWRVLQTARPYLWRIVLGLVLAAAVVITTLFIPVLSGRAVDTIVGRGAVDFPQLIAVLVQIIASLAVTALSQWLMTALTTSAAYHIVRDIRIAAFSKLQRLPIQYIDSHGHGDIVSRIITDADQLSEGLIVGCTQLFTGALTIGLTLVFMVRLNLFITFIVMGVTPLSFCAAAFIAKKSYTHFRNQSVRRGELTAFVQEMMTGISCVDAFGMQNTVCKKFAARDEALRTASFSAVFFSSITNPATRFVNALMYAGVGMFGALSVVAGNLSVGQLTSFLGYASQYTKPFNEISGVVTELQNSLACARRLFELLDESEIVPDVFPAGATVQYAGDAVIQDTGDAPLRGALVSAPITVPNGAVVFSDVDFSYVPARPFIERLSFTAHPGEHIAIVGPTGCGKTTLINLLLRFYEVNAGNITIGGKDIRSMRYAELRAAYGMVLQETWLKHATVKENIRFGKPDATDEDVERAARESFAEQFICRLPHGYDTVVGDGGNALSEGQKQLLCIARVMLAPPPMLVLDEATASIDTRTELCIQRAFDKLMEGRTSFVVAHRLSTIRTADMILVMKEGSIIESGTHEALLARGGFYSTLYNSQFEPTA